MLFTWIKNKTKSKSKTIPIVHEVKLLNEYEFMFENCLFSTQKHLYCILELEGNLINLLKFPFIQYKYGLPNDENKHPVQKHGMGLYGVFEIENSPWIHELKELYPNVSNITFKSQRHFIIRFKDLTLEVISTGFEELQFTKPEFNKLINNQIDFMED